MKYILQGNELCFMLVSISRVISVTNQSLDSYENKQHSEKVHEGLIILEYEKQSVQDVMAFTC